jgi:hypothetical protein
LEKGPWCRHVEIIVGRQQLDWENGRTSIVTKTIIFGRKVGFVGPDSFAA